MEKIYDADKKMIGAKVDVGFADKFTDFCKNNDLVFLGESIITIRKDLANLLERQDKIAKEQGAYFEENFMELSEIVMTNQKRILKLYETGSY